ncbi:MAG TPA: penicillin-binding transpeptidase domain-containing protein, partial [Acidimicrobiales bacterium]|nr:penicillin-binding transpeptidase domain-containing protein [Acidimicrobiales bacterium]
SYQTGTVRRHGSTADASYTAHLMVSGLGTWRLPGTLHLRRRANHWLVEWTPATIHPALTPGGHFVVDRRWAPRADILGAAGAQLTGPVSMVSIGLEGSRIKDPGPVTSALVQAGADAGQVSGAVTQAAAHPDQFVLVFDVTDDRYQQLRPSLYPVPGIIFERHSVRAALTSDLTAHVVGSVGPITAEELKTLGAPYQPGDMVGQAGIEAVFERTLAGTPGGDVKVLDATGRPVATAFSIPSKAGTPVQTTIDPRTERAAEAALDRVGQPAAVVAVRASTGEILAAVSRPVSAPFDRALNGRYPPGSTFKVITTAALLAGGLTPTSPASCPPTIAVGGRTFHNFEGETQLNLSLQLAFAKSCNTAYIGLASALSSQDLISTAAKFGFGSDPRIGLSAFGGRVPAPVDQVEKVASAIGQSKVEASPLMMATVAAAVDAGFVHPPRLVAGADDSATATPLDPAVVSGLRPVMAAVVAQGTAAGTGLPPGTFGKTGTAEFGNANPPATHAWFIGFRGDVAFAVLVEGGGVGGQVAAPLAARFLSALG